jgi:hypothetical protein
MVIYIDQVNTQSIMSRGQIVSEPNWKDLVGKTIKHIQKIDGKIMITLK